MKLNKVIKEPYILNPADYIKPHPSMPLLDSNKIYTDAVYGLEEQRRLKTTTTGDASLIIGYRKKEGGVISVKEKAHGELREILQIQGARGGYRLCTGMDWHKFLGKEIGERADKISDVVREIHMPHIRMISGMEDYFSELAYNRYVDVIKLLNLSWSDENKKYIGEIKRSKEI